MDYRNDDDRKVIDLNTFIRNRDGKDTSSDITDNFDEEIIKYKKSIDFNPFSADHQFMVADFCLQNEMTSESLEYLKKTVEIDPDKWEAHYNLGIVFTSFNYSDQAVEHFMEVIRLEPSHVYTYLNLTNIFLKKDDLQEALYILEKGMDNIPGERLLMNNCGVVLARLEKYTEAIKIWEELEELFPDELEACYNQAITYSRMGMTEVAIVKFRKIIELGYGDFGVYANLGNLYEKKNDIEEAEKAYIKALEYEPDDYSVKSAYGLLQAKKGDYDKAISIYRSICSEDPFNIKNKMNLAMIYAIQGKFHDAVSVLTEAEKIEADDPDLLLNLAINYMNMKDYGISDDYFLRTIKLNPHNEEPYLHYSKSLIERGKHSDAFDILKKGHSRLPECSTILFLLCRSCLTLNIISEGITYARRLISLSPEMSAPYLMLIDLYRKKGNSSKVWLVYEKAVENVSDDSELLIKYADELRENSFYRKSLEIYLKALKILPRCQEVLYRISQIYDILGEQEKAREYTEKCEKINPFSEWARKSR